MFYVRYVVTGFPGVQQAGPYSAGEVQSQRDDIAGFEGVHSVSIVPVEPEESVTDKLDKAFE